MSEALGTDPGNGIKGYGTTLQGSIAGPIGMITKLNFDGQDVTDIDITTMNSVGGWKKFIAGLKDSKMLNLDLLYEPTNTKLLIGLVGGANQNWTVTFPDTCSMVVSGYLKSLGTAIPIDDKISQTAAFRLSGPPAFNVPSGIV